jgi:hypothetical protein
LVIYLFEFVWVEILITIIIWIVQFEVFKFLGEFIDTCTRDWSIILTYNCGICWSKFILRILKIASIKYDCALHSISWLRQLKIKGGFWVDLCKLLHLLLVKILRITVYWF